MQSAKHRSALSILTTLAVALGGCGDGSGSPAPFCGDGNVDVGEACDDANMIDGDGCEADCTLTPTELVRVLISDMVGSETATVSSLSDPDLFVLDPRIASVELTAVNSEGLSKSDRGAATWLPSLTPMPPATSTAGYIELTITPVVGESISYGTITYTTRAQFASNPTSLRLQSSDDGFASTLSTIPLDMDRTETVALSTTASDAPYAFRWEAHNDFGEFGGGECGFAAGDVVITD